MVSLSTPALEQFFAAEDDQPIVMLNQLHFMPDAGRQTYLDYLASARPILARYGADILFGGDGLPVLTRGAAETWDAVVLVRYPNRTTFRDMIADPAYREVFRIGEAALAGIVLQPLAPCDAMGAAPLPRRASPQ
ncbi:protein of unknown function [Sphingomonas guangdongensis]|uniref:DUF1330 domain-containing protein n=1 Tax=Sphingomonas guangdongensis TaxID=1141890 RepID=A0A285QYW2_9SPHN|nr:DUF1330 domain-containing protein [Sphingomonas guangdongensis]SOB87026.1 protein of unknown function [Sphingomonas guangdongensis]